MAPQKLSNPLFYWPFREFAPFEAPVAAFCQENHFAYPRAWPAAGEVGKGCARRGAFASRVCGLCVLGSALPCAKHSPAFGARTGRALQNCCTQRRWQSDWSANGAARPEAAPYHGRLRWDNGHLARCGNAGIVLVRALEPLAPAAARERGPPAGRNKLRPSRREGCRRANGGATVAIPAMRQRARCALFQ